MKKKDVFRPKKNFNPDLIFLDELNPKFNEIINLFFLNKNGGLGPNVTHLILKESRLCNLTSLRQEVDSYGN